MSELPPVSTAAALTALSANLQAQPQALANFVRQQAASDVEKLFDLVGSGTVQLEIGTKLNAVIVPLPNAAELLVAPEGSFTLEAPLPAAPTAPADSAPQQGEPAAATATLIVEGGDNPIHAALVALNGKTLPAPVPLDLIRLSPGVELPATPSGTDALRRTIFVSPAGVFALAPEQTAHVAGNGEAPPPLTLRLAQPGPELQAEIIAAGSRQLDEPLSVSLARLAPGLEFPAVPAGTDSQGRSVLATPVGIFLSSGEPPKDSAVLTLRVVANAPNIETEIVAKDGKAQPAPARLSLLLPDAASLPRPPPPQLAETMPQPQAAKILSALGNSWPALNEAMAALKASDPEIAKALFERIPAAGPKFIAQLLGLLAGLKAGDAAAFLGNDVLDALRRAGHEQIAARLDEDVKATSQLAQQSSGEWRPVLMPFFDGANLQQVPMMIGRPPEHQTSSSEPGTRFLVCVDFSALGAIQIDGFIAPDQRRLDVTIRSAAALPDAVKDGVEARFNEAAVSNHFGGRLQFKVANPFPIQILEQLRFGSGKRLGTIA